MSISKIPGYLEIDHDRGVAYFHTNSEEAAKDWGSVTLVRIQGLSPRPYPLKQIDIRLPQSEGLGKEYTDFLSNEELAT